MGSTKSKVAQSSPLEREHRSDEHACCFTGVKRIFSRHKKTKGRVLQVMVDDGDNENDNDDVVLPYICSSNSSTSSVIFPLHEPGSSSIIITNAIVEQHNDDTNSDDNDSGNDDAVLPNVFGSGSSSSVASDHSTISFEPGSHAIISPPDDSNMALMEEPLSCQLNLMTNENAETSQDDHGRIADVTIGFRISRTWTLNHLTSVRGIYQARFQLDREGGFRFIQQAAVQLVHQHGIQFVHSIVGREDDDEDVDEERAVVVCGEAGNHTLQERNVDESENVVTSEDEHVGIANVRMEFRLSLTLTLSHLTTVRGIYQAGFQFDHEGGFRFIQQATIQVVQQDDVQFVHSIVGQEEGDMDVDEETAVVLPGETGNLSNQEIPEGYSGTESYFWTVVNNIIDGVSWVFGELQEEL